VAPDDALTLLLVELASAALAATATTSAPTSVPRTPVVATFRALRHRPGERPGFSDRRRLTGSSYVPFA
jgi:hypothetical protein